MKKITTLLFLTLLAYQGFAQIAIEWQKQLGGSKEDLATTIIQTSDGGILAFGESYSIDGDASGLHGFSDIWVVKMDPNGVIEWQRMYGGSYGEFGRSILQTKDGGYIFSGLAYSNDGDISNHIDIADCWVVKIDVSGNIEWEKSFSSGPVSEPTDIIQTEDGGYVVAASGSIYDFWFFKLDAQGDLEWDKFYGGSKEEHLDKIRQTPDKGFILSGGSYSNNGDVTGHHGPTTYADFWIVKTDSLGNLEWQKSLGGSFYDEAFNILVTSDGGYLAGGVSQSNDWDVSGHHGAVGTSIDTWVVKLDAQGNILWSRSLGGSATADRAFYAMLETAEGDYLLAGQTDSSDGDLLGLAKGSWDCWILKLSNTGAILWQKVLGGTKDDAIIDMAQTTDGGFVAVGISNSTDGDVTVPIHPAAPGATWFDFWVVKLNLLTGTEELPTGSLQVFPNPFSGSFSIMSDLTSPIGQFSLFNVWGQKVL
ncbi:MAG: hypothetical protein H7246_11810, partial [Phycisphaerae bacterium]|nr:hypothetical protein [Saprospiraceae bacterium]